MRRTLQKLDFKWAELQSSTVKIRMAKVNCQTNSVTKAMANSSRKSGLGTDTIAPNSVAKLLG
jgi:hypothetical protein